MTRAFLELLAGAEGPASAPALQDAIRGTLDQVWTRYRAATASDYELLTRDEWPKTAEAVALKNRGLVDRVHCISEYDLESKPAKKPGHLSVVVLPKYGNLPHKDLKAALWRFFEPRRLLTARHHIVNPSYVRVRIYAKLYLRDDAVPAATHAHANAALKRWLDPHVGGDDGRGWPFGGDLHISDLYTLLDAIPGVSFVTELTAGISVPWRGFRTANVITGFRLRLHELLAFNMGASNLQIFEPAGDVWKKVRV
jgi:hypothetical protein